LTTPPAAWFVSSGLFGNPIQGLAAVKMRFEVVDVNLTVSHPHRSRSAEPPVGMAEIVPAELLNGYGERVAGLYSNRKNAKLKM
jgi:hypothetical protein